MLSHLERARHRLCRSARARAGARIGALLVGLAVIACQDYPFEMRETRRVDAKEINELVATLTPADILFVVDNSGTMEEEITALKNNIERFVTQLSASELDFQVGIITTDVECNLPTKFCGPGGSSDACCFLDTTVCTDEDTNGDGKIDRSSCEGGRLVAAPASNRRIFRRPAPEERDAWVSDVVSAIDAAKHNLKGSSYEGGLEAAYRAIGCAVGDPSCTDQAVKDLNEGFIRPEADLVVIFVTDEDDCSVRDPVAYTRPNNPADLTEQAIHFCSPNECYAHYGAELDQDGDGLQDWADTSTLVAQRLRCSGNDRQVNPPSLADIGIYVDALATFKGGIHRVRAAGILSAVPSSEAPLGYGAAGCYNALGGPSDQCGCLSGSSDFFCLVTAENDQLSSRVPAGQGLEGGCQTAPGGRYVQFLEDLAATRIAASQNPDTLADSICRDNYDATMDRIVNNVIIVNCFELGVVPSSPNEVRVILNGQKLANVEPDSDEPGWSLRQGATKICLEGGLEKKINDRFEIMLITASQ